jgi:hypothetical protein
MRQVHKGTIEGNVIRLEQPVQLPQGTSIIVSFSTFNQEKQEAIQQRQLRRLEQGFPLGKKLYTHREELYDRAID